MDQNKYPAGWDAARVQRVLRHYETQTADEAALEDEKSWEDRTQTVMEIPVELVPKVRELISKNQK